MWKAGYCSGVCLKFYNVYKAFFCSLTASLCSMFSLCLSPPPNRPHHHQLNKGITCVFMLSCIHIEPQAWIWWESCVSWCNTEVMGSPQDPIWEMTEHRESCICIGLNLFWSTCWSLSSSPDLEITQLIFGHVWYEWLSSIYVNCRLSNDKNKQQQRVLIKHVHFAPSSVGQTLQLFIFI